MRLGSGSRSLGSLLFLSSIGTTAPYPPVDDRTAGRRPHRGAGGAGPHLPQRPVRPPRARRLRPGVPDPRDPEAAEDVVQDAFLAAWRGAGTFRRERGNARSGLLSIAHHRAVDLLRRRTALRPAPLEAADRTPSDLDTADEAARNVERGTARAALEKLPEAQRRTIELAYFGGYTQSELAQLMGVPLGSVRGGACRAGRPPAAPLARPPRPGRGRRARHRRGPRRGGDAAPEPRDGDGAVPGDRREVRRRRADLVHGRRRRLARHGRQPHAAGVGPARVRGVPRPARARARRGLRALAHRSRREAGARHELPARRPRSPAGGGRPGARRPFAVRRHRGALDGGQARGPGRHAVADRPAHAVEVCLASTA
ncbi:MAG: sigma-70 family RNA polymerase sigma factor [Chloroflexi bacterium]|nr:sigma-70 family RNA polymerase sigma factor [Chloroflexota bacterium]